MNVQSGSIREEISKIMAEYTYNLYKNKTIDATIPEKILKLIEKRIDSIKERKETDSYLGYSGDQEFLDGFDIAWDEAFEKIKEMLK